VRAASGRLILGWFPARRRGLALGVRQTAQPLGVGAAALVLPVLGDRSSGTAFAVLAAACAAAAVLVLVVMRDAPLATETPCSAAISPYRARSCGGSSQQPRSGSTRAPCGGGP
jgi:sugar phosphate permease